MTGKKKQKKKTIESEIHKNLHNEFPKTLLFLSEEVSRSHLGCGNGV